jgi:hypothetical protein
MSNKRRLSELAWANFHARGPMTLLPYLVLCPWREDGIGIE